MAGWRDQDRERASIANWGRGVEIGVVATSKGEALREGQDKEMAVGVGLVVHSMASVYRGEEFEALFLE